jgi:electron transfer flavoprotein alpha subunit
MAGLLVLIQHEEGEISKASLAALQAATEIAAKQSISGIDCLCLGPNSKSAAEQLKSYPLENVWFCEDRALEKYVASSWSAAVLQAIEQSSAQVFVAAATSTGKDFAPRVAAAVDAGQASDIVAVNDDGSLKRPMYAGDVLADVKIATDKKVITVRSTAFPACEAGSGATEVKELQFSLEGEAGAEVSGYELSGGDRPDLTEAETVVSAGRAMQSAENFEKYIFPLADALGAAVGASRAAVDSGYAPNDWQVGQTGKVVAPNLYIAIGISGAIQHLAGMKDSKVIVAINKDPDAPIFEIADYGLVADLYEVVPELTSSVEGIKS